MVRFLLLLILSLLLTPNLVAQKHNSSDKDYLSGPVSEEQIREYKIFDLYAKRYEPDDEIIAKFNSVADSVLIDVFFGTWCHDSKREVPAFFKLMNVLDNDKIAAKYTAIEYRRRGPKDIIKKNNIKRTPTFVVYINGKEAGRLIEESEKSVEEDIWEIIEKKIQLNN